jgi:hypothetical protein
MNIVRIIDPEPELERQLAEFEKSFTYPLGGDQRFSISHGPRYDNFFSSLGSHCCLAAVHDGRVLATIGAAKRNICHSDGSAHEALYVGDLKIAHEARGSRLLWRVLRELSSWPGPQSALFSVVMDGTNREPPHYTGRAGIPAFKVIAKISILRVTTTKANATEPARRITAIEFSALHRQLSHGRMSVTLGDVSRRRSTTFQYLALSDATACAVLEDTSNAKRLFDQNGKELRTAHCSSFAYKNIDAAKRLLMAASVAAADSGFPALFAAIPKADNAAVVEQIVPIIESFPATIFGHGVPSGEDWLMNSSEI